MTKKKTITTKRTSSSESENKNAIQKTSANKIKSTLNGRLLHLSVSTDLDDQEEIDLLHEKIESRIEKKLKENGVENCIVFVSGHNIKLNLM